MIRAKHQSLGDIVGRIIAASVGIAAGALLVTQIPSMWRYMKIKQMAKSRGDGASELLPPMDSPTYAQAPRRAVSARI